MKLENLKVNSFVTVVDREHVETAKGGWTSVLGATIVVTYDIGKQESAWYCEPKKEEGNGGGN